MSCALVGCPVTGEDNPLGEWGDVQNDMGRCTKVINHLNFSKLSHKDIQGILNFLLE